MKMTDIKQKIESEYLGISKYDNNDIEWYEDFWDKLIDILREKYDWGIKLKLSGYCLDYHLIYPTDLTCGSLTTRFIHKNGKKLVEATILVWASVDIPFDEPNEDATFESDNIEELAKKLNEFALEIDRKIREKVVTNEDSKSK